MVTNKDIIGTWLLVERGSDDPDNAAMAEKRYGDAQEGVLIVSLDGWMNAALCHGARPALTGNPAWHTDAPEADRLAAFNTYISYAGTWTLKDDVFTTDVRFALNPGWVGGEQARGVEITPDGYLILSLSREWPDGRVVSGWVRWRRADVSG
jgi:hypothetical protein